MKEVEMININSLITHPQNNYFFDDMAGESWEKFLISIKDGGIKDPIIITQNNVIVSGHQRLRAAKELGMETVPVIKEEYVSDDDILKDLIELNIRQRGVMADSETKAGRRFKELKRIYGIKHGGNRGNQYTVKGLDGKVAAAQFEQVANSDISTSENKKVARGQIVPLANSDISTLEDLAKANGISKRKMNRTIQVANADPQLQEWNISGKISGDTVRYIMSTLSPEERNEFYLNNEDVEKIRKKDIDEIKEKDILISNLRSAQDILEDRLKAKTTEIRDLKRKKDAPKIGYAEKEVILSELDDAQSRVQELEEQIRQLQLEKEEKNNYINELESNAEAFVSAAYLERSNTDIYRAVDGTDQLYDLNKKVINLLETDLAPLKFRRCFERVAVSDVARSNVKELIDSVYEWCNEIYGIINTEETIIDA